MANPQKNIKIGIAGSLPWVQRGPQGEIKFVCSNTFATATFPQLRFQGCGCRGCQGDGQVPRHRVQVGEPVELGADQLGGKRHLPHEHRPSDGKSRQIPNCGLHVRVA